MFQEIKANQFYAKLSDLETKRSTYWVLLVVVNIEYTVGFCFVLFLVVLYLIFIQRYIVYL